MKTMLILVFGFNLLTSCGPHRMSCGPRGICKTSEIQIQDHRFPKQDKSIARI